MKPIAYLMVGVPGSGKSTWAEPYLARPEQFNLISSDIWIEQIASALGKTYGEVFKDVVNLAMQWMNDQLALTLRAGMNLVWDQTNLTPKSRRQKIDSLKAAGYEVVAVTFEIPDAELKARREKRQEESGKAIPASVLETMGKTYVRPTRVEGFDRVIIVTPSEEYESLD